MTIILILFIFSFLGLVIHGNPPMHYYVTVAPLITILVSFVISKLKVNIYLVLLVFLIINSMFYFSSKGLYRKGNYNMQVEVTKKLIKDANGQKFNLKRVGDFDYYDDDYAQNYQYLLWLYGNEPVKTDEVLKYTIYEEPDNIYFKKE